MSRSVPPGLGAQCLRQLGAQRTADPSAHGRRSTAIGEGISSPRDNLLVYQFNNSEFGSRSSCRNPPFRLFTTYLSLSLQTLTIIRPLNFQWTNHANSYSNRGGSVAEWLACWTQAQKARVQIVAATLSGNSLRKTVHTHCASVHQAAKLVAAFLRDAGVTAGLAESNVSLPPGL